MSDLPEGIGQSLWRAAQVLRARFESGLAERGLPPWGDAVATLMRMIGSDGISQAELAERTRLTKQAVQQHLDDLERAGLIRREPDPRDARRRVVRFTPQGYEALGALVEVTVLIEAELAALLGASGLADLKAALGAIAALPEKRKGG